MRVTVLGGGNMGSILATKFSQVSDVTLYLNAPYETVSEYSKNLIVFNEDFNTHVEGKIKNITEDLCCAIKDAEFIFVTFPSFLFDSLSKELIPLLELGQHLVFVPGSGGAEIVFKDALAKGCTITGLQRVHSVARIIEKGKEVRESGVRDSINCASIPCSFNETAREVLSNLYSLPVNGLDNYLNITLVNSNPILHTSRLYTIFKDYPDVDGYDSLPLFYENWDLESSELLVKMDGELFEMFDVLRDNGICVNQITSLLLHYDSTNAIEMTHKLNSINSLKGLATPHVVADNGKLLPDLKSRYFTADFPYGLDILLSFAKVLDKEVPNMKQVSNWYHKVMNLDTYFDLGKYGINSISDLRELYLL